jgi:signal transduction histidine kinase
MKLRTHYWLLAFCIVCPIVLFFSISLDMLLSSQRAVALRRIEESARSVRQEVDAEIRRAQSVLRVLSYSQALGQGDFARFYREAQSANAGQGAWIILYDSTGQQQVNTRLAFGTPLPVRPDVGVLEGMLASGAGMVSGIKWGPALKQHYLTVDMPITAASGARYVLTQAFSPGYFTRTYAGRVIPDTWPVWIVDGKGTMIARRDMGDARTGSLVPPDVLDALRRATAGSVRHDGPDGNDIYGYFVHSALSDWAVIVGAPVAEVNAALMQGLAVAVAGFLVAIAAAVGLGVYTGRRLVRFVSNASRAARALGGESAVALLRKSNIGEMEALNDAIRDADARLRREMATRVQVEQERNELFERERAARAYAEQQNTAKDEFMAMLGHELRNPLGAITSAVAVLDHASKPGMPAEASERAREVLRRQSAHLRSLVDDLLEVNRALMGKLALNRQRMDLGEAVRSCVDMLQSSGKLKTHQVEVALAPAVVQGDPTRLAQVIDNILDNAVKYSPAGTLVAIDVRQVDEEAVLSVRDQGIGITPDLLPHVFKVFVQGKQTLQRAQGGLGIGLTLVRRLVEMHGGTIAVSSDGLNQGVTVTIRLPLADAPQRPSAPTFAGVEETVWWR